MKQGEGKLVFGQKKVKGETKRYDTAILYIPAKIATDSAFPFQPPQRVKISILDGSKLLVEKIE